MGHTALATVVELPSVSITVQVEQTKYGVKQLKRYATRPLNQDWRRVVESIQTYEAIHSDPQSHNFLTTMAPRHSFSILLVAILLFTETTVAVVVISQNYATILCNCSTSDNYTIASSYKMNLVKLMANLEPDSVDDHGFRMSSAGEPPDAIFSLTMCYADSNWDQCQKCLRAGIASMPETCPSSRCPPVLQWVILLRLRC
jgi:hypothetical protein